MLAKKSVVGPLQFNFFLNNFSRRTEKTVKMVGEH